MPSDEISRSDIELTHGEIELIKVPDNMVEYSVEHLEELAEIRREAGNDLQADIVEHLADRMYFLLRTQGEKYD